MFTGEVSSPVSGCGGSEGQGDAAIQLANALSACVLSTHLPHSHRQWAATQLVCGLDNLYLEIRCNVWIEYDLIFQFFFFLLCPIDK